MANENASPPGYNQLFNAAHILKGHRRKANSHGLSKSIGKAFIARRKRHEVRARGLALDIRGNTHQSYPAFQSMECDTVKQSRAVWSLPENHDVPIGKSC